MRVDVPEGDGFKTEFYGLGAIYAVRFTSEQIARAFARRTPEIVAYDAPIVTREQHEAVVERLESRNSRLREEIDELRRRLISVRALPAPEEDGA